MFVVTAYSVPLIKKKSDIKFRFVRRTFQPLFLRHNYAYRAREFKHIPLAYVYKNSGNR